MKAVEYRKLSLDELSAKTVDMREEIGKMRLQHSIRPLENTAKLSQLKKNIARIETVITEKSKSL